MVAGARNFLRRVYHRLFKINDTPQKIALGAGLGVFTGIMPGAGPVAAICLAYVLRANRAAALLGSLLTNTWLSFVIFLLAVKTGSFMLGLSWRQLYRQYLQVLQVFNWKQALQASFLKFILPVLIGYIVIGLVLGLVTYICAIVILKIHRRG